MKRNIIIFATGGTGGHIFPAVALAEELEKRNYKIIYAVDKKFKNFTKDVKCKYHEILSSPMKINLIDKMISLIINILGVLQSIILIIKYNPKMVVGFGGYCSFPTCLASKLMGVDFIIHEQNSILGTANKYLANYAKKIAVSYKNTLNIPIKAKDKIIFTGNPVRKEITDIAKVGYVCYKNKGDFNILIIGGSQGASLFSQVIPDALSKLNEKDKIRLNIIQQSKLAEVDNIKEKYNQSGIKSEISAFFGNISQKYSTAHLVISRSGATTIAELIKINKPSILIPIKDSILNHQYLNAKILNDESAAWMIEEKDFNSDKLKSLIENIINNPKDLLTRSESLNKFKTNDIQKFVEVILNPTNNY